jgi:hypothetical protein
MRPYVFFALAATAATLVSSAHSAIVTSKLNFSDEVCREAAKAWMWDGMPPPQLDNRGPILTVSWAGLDEALALVGCAPASDVWLELWRTSGNLDGISWTHETMYNYGGCKQFPPEFRQHDARHRRAGAATAVFRHVVERRYVLRLCPCGRPDARGACNCEYADGGAYCSRIISLPGVVQSDVDIDGRTFNTQEGVFPWCRDGASRFGETAPMPELSNPTLECDGTGRVKGVMASCTPVMVGDYVDISMFKVSKDVTTCGKNHHATEQLAFSNGTKLFAINKTHGEFTVAANSLEDGAQYCLMLDLNHPYCFPHNSNPMPKVCHVYVKSPLATPTKEECAGKGERVNLAGSNSGERRGRLAPWAVGVISLTVAALVVLIFCSYMWLRRRGRKNLTKMTEIFTGQVEATREERAPVLATEKESPPPQILLLHFPEKNPAYGLAVTALANWLRSLGYRVRDPTDEEEQEEVAAHQEAWAEKIMAEERNRALIVYSPAAGSAAADDLVGSDPLAAMRANAVTYLTSNFVGDYRRVLVVSFSQPPPPGDRLTAAWPQRQLLLPGHAPEVAAFLDRPTAVADKQLTSAAAALAALA